MSAFLSTVQTITADDPIFSGVTDDTLEEWIALAVVNCDATRWSSLYVQGVAYLAAHMYARGPGLASSGGAAIGGSTAERRARNWSIRFHGPTSGASAADDDLRQTAYGLTYLRLRAMTRGPSLVTPSV